MNIGKLSNKAAEGGAAAMDDREYKRQNHIDTCLPYEMIETILSRLPSKYLFRFRSVCKKWKATISDPKFFQAHLLQSNSSFSSYLLTQIHSDFFTRVEIQSNEFRRLPAMEDRQPVKLDPPAIWCYCDGLILFSYPSKNGLVLWNPSTGTWRNLHCPYPLLSSPTPIGICYVPLLDDFKVVVQKPPHDYAVYRCKTKSWVQREEMETSPIYNTKVLYHYGVPFDGSIYWIVYRGKNSGNGILCFDGRDEEFKILPPIDRLKGVGNWAGLISSVHGLYLFPYHRPCPLTNELVFMEKVGDSWMEQKVQLPFPSGFVIPLCWSNEDNKIMLKVCFPLPGVYLIYDVRKRCCVEIRNSLGLSFCRLVPYVENMLLL